MINFRFGAATASLPATMGFAALLLTSAAPTAVYAQTSEEPAEAAQTASAPPGFSAAFAAASPLGE